LIFFFVFAWHPSPFFHLLSSPSSFSFFPCPLLALFNNLKKMIGKRKNTLNHSESQSSSITLNSHSHPSISARRTIIRLKHSSSALPSPSTHYPSTFPSARPISNSSLFQRADSDSSSLPPSPRQLQYHQQGTFVKPTISSLGNLSKLPLDLSINNGIKKLVFLGDKDVGKTSMIQSILKSYNQPCPLQESPITSTLLPELYRLSTEDLNLVLVDTSGDEELDRLRIVSYEQVDVWVLCFSLTSRESLQSIVDRWLPEVSYCNRNLPIVLVGCQSDMQRMISYEEVQS
jgi:small GTP-binding protein